MHNIFSPSTVITVETVTLSQRLFGHFLLCKTDTYRRQAEARKPWHSYLCVQLHIV